MRADPQNDHEVPPVTKSATPTPLTPMELLAQALRDELIATRWNAGLDGPRALARKLEPEGAAEARRSQATALREHATRLEERGRKAAAKSKRAAARKAEDMSEHVPYWAFERGRVKWPDDVDQRVRDYATATGVEPIEIWLGVAQRWLEALAGGDETARADRISDQD